MGPPEEDLEVGLPPEEEEEEEEFLFISMKENMNRNYLKEMWE